MSVFVLYQKKKIINAMCDIGLKISDIWQYDWNWNNMKET